MMSKINPPKCYAQYRSPQSDAENCCGDCRYDYDCMIDFKARHAIAFFCPMIPPTTTAQMHQVSVVNGKPHFYDPPEVEAARAKLLSALCKHMPGKPFDGGVRLLVKWCFPLSGRHRDGEYRTIRPDTDNLEKLLKDVMTHCGFWHDDAQVCSEIVEKFWAEKPGIFIRIEEIGGDCG